MAAVYIITWGSVLVFGALAVAALVWAIESGQFRDLKGASASIFDEEEPAGLPADRYPEGESR